MNRNYFLRSLLLAALPFTLLLAGCGDEPPLVEGSTEPPLTKVHPPARPTEGATANGPGATFVFSGLDFGGGNQGMFNSEAWRVIGYDLDNKSTRGDASGSCAPVAGSSQGITLDGEDARDNSFGKNIVPLAFGLDSAAPQNSNQILFAGAHSVLIDVPGLGDEKVYSKISIRLYEAATLTDAEGNPKKPAFDGSDVWPVAVEALKDGDVNKPVLTTEEGYLVDDGEGGTLVGRFSGALPIRMALLGALEENMVAFRFQNPLVTMKLSADRKRIELGVVAGTLELAEVQEDAARVIGLFEPSLCGSVTLTSIQNQIANSADILRDLSNNPGKTCEVASAAVLFEADRAQIGPVAPPQKPPAKTCQ